MPPVQTAPAARQAAPVVAPAHAVAASAGTPAESTPGWEGMDAAAGLLQAAPDAPAFKQGAQAASVPVSPPPPFVGGAEGALVAPREVTVEFLRFWRGYQRGQRAGFLSNVADMLVRGNVAIIPAGPIRAVSSSRMVAK